MDIREVDSFWIKDIYYFEDSKERRYLCHDNTFVYDDEGTMIEYWKRLPGKRYYILPLSKTCDVMVKQNFLVADINEKNSLMLNDFSSLMLNGKKILPMTDWFHGWVQSKFYLPSMYSLEGLFDLKVKPYTKMGKNRIFFTLEGLATSTAYIRHLSRIKEIENRSRSIPMTRKYLKFVTELPADFPTKRWRKERTSNIHFGQLKLLLAEIEFLTSVSSTYNQPVLVLYPGGGPGDHVPLLSQLFPNVYFILVDPVFETEARSIKIVPDEKIIIRPELFTEMYISQFRNLNAPIAMISDIRSIPPEGVGKKGSEAYEKEFEKHAKFDMDLQQRWFKELNGPDTLLKFRLPYIPGDTKYLCGKLYMQAYPPELSTELRLVPELKDCIYNNTEIEQKMFYFNTEYRPSNFYDIDPLFGKNYDTLRQSKILGNFLKWRGLDDDQRNIFNMISIIDDFFGRRRISDYLLL